MIREEPPERIATVSLTLLAGFLGAGKTTLLNELVRAQHGVRVGVLVNDFGEIDIDAELVARVDGETIALTNGCICCTIKDDMLLTLFRLLHRPDAPEHVIVECSGISDPVEVLRGFEEARLFEIVRVDSVVVVVDAEQFAEVEFRERPLLLHQLVCADLAVLNKTDLVDAQTLAAVQQRIRATVPGVRIVAAERGRVPYDLVLGVGRFDPAKLLEHGVHDHAHHDEFVRWGFHTPERLDVARLRAALDDLPLGVYRAKGIVAVPGESRRIVVHVVGKRVELDYGAPWENAPQSKLVAVGRDFDPAALTERFAGCIATARDAKQNPVLGFVRRLWSGDKKQRRSRGARRAPPDRGGGGPGGA
jgi:G3E family GTPase